MTAIIYPSTLPGPSVSAVTPTERRLLSDLTGAPQQARGLQRDYLATQHVEWAVLSASEAAMFYEWWKNTLTYGGAWFASTWPAPQGWVSIARRFIGAPAWTNLPGGFWRVSAEVQVRGRGELPFAFATGCDLFQPTDRGLFLDFTVPDSMLNASGAVAAPGEYVHTAIPCGTYPNFTCTADGPKAGSGYLQTFGSVGSAVLNASALMNAYSKGGVTIAVSATEPATIGLGDVASIIDSQRPTPSEFFRGPEFTASGTQFFTFVNDADPSTYDYLGGSYARTAGARTTIVATSTGSTMKIVRDGSTLAIGAAANQLKDGGVWQSIACSFLGTLDLIYAPYAGKIYSILAIDRALSSSEISGYTAWANSRPL